MPALPWSSVFRGPVLHYLFHRFVVPVGYPQQVKFTGSLNGLLIKGLGFKAGLYGVAHTVITAIDPRIDLEGFAGDQ